MLKFMAVAILVYSAPAGDVELPYTTLTIDTVGDVTIVLESPVIFSSGFESGNTNDWKSN